jgi:hypothetical protein
MVRPKDPKASPLSTTLGSSLLFLGPRPRRACAQRVVRPGSPSWPRSSERLRYGDEHDGVPRRTKSQQGTTLCLDAAGPYSARHHKEHTRACPWVRSHHGRGSRRCRPCSGATRGRRKPRPLHDKGGPHQDQECGWTGHRRMMLLKAGADDRIAALLKKELPDRPDRPSHQQRTERVRFISRPYAWRARRGGTRGTREHAPYGGACDAAGAFGLPKQSPNGARAGAPTGSLLI